jgi:hypothetical protein
MQVKLDDIGTVESALGQTREEQFVEPVMHF